MNFSFLAKLLRGFRWQISLILLMGLASVLLSMLPIEIGRQLIDMISSPGSNAPAKTLSLVTYCLALFGAALAAALLNHALTVCFTRFNLGLLTELRLTIFAHLIKLPQEVYNKNTLNKFSSRITDEASYLSNYISKIFYHPFINLLKLILFSVYLFNLNWRLALVGTFLIPLSALVMPRLNRRAQFLTGQQIAQKARLTDLLHEVFGGIADIRSNQTYRYEEAKLQGHLGTMFSTNMDLARASGMLDTVMLVVSQLGPVLVYLYGGVLCFKGELAVGSLVAALAIIGSLNGPVNYLISFLIDWRIVKMCLVRLDEYLQLPTEPDVVPTGEGAGRFTGEITFDGVELAFPGERPLLHGITFSTPPGRKIAFVGTSGSGKSLTVSLINRIYRPSRGNILFDGTAIESIRLRELRSGIGYVNQSPFIFSDTLRNNILYGTFAAPESAGGPGAATVTDQQMVELVRDVGLYEDVLRFGLMSRLDAVEIALPGTLRDDVVALRKEFRHWVEVNQVRHVERYEAGRFLEYCSIFDNLVFCPASEIEARFGSRGAFCKSYLYGELGRVGLLDELLSASLRLLHDCADSDALFPEPRSRSLEQLLALASSATSGGAPAVDPEEVQRLVQEDPEALLAVLSLVFDYVSGTAKDDIADEPLKARVLELRRSFMTEFSGKGISFFDAEAYHESLSLRENILLGNVNPMRKQATQMVGEFIQQALQDAGLTSLIVKIGLEFNVGERGRKLSGGQKQKVAVARTLLKQPDILILDEATSALDASSQKQIVDLVNDKFRDKSVISIAHRLNIIKDYDDIFVFDQGQIVERGSFDDLMSREGLFRELYDRST